jgi:hypothetical protein
MPIYHYQKPKPVFSGTYKKSDLVMPSGAVFDAPLASNASSAVTGQALTTSGNVTYSTVDGIPCVTLDGSSGLSCSDAGLPGGSNPVSISIWANQKQIQSGYRQLITYGTWSANSAVALCYVNGAIGYGFHTYDCTPFDNSDVGKWHHFLLTSTGEQNQFYIDGKFAGEWIHQRNTVPGQITIGRRDSTNTYFHGFLAGCRIYDRVLTDDEILTLSKEFIPSLLYSTSTGFDDMGFAVPYDMASDAGCDRSMIPKDGLLCYFSMDDTGGVAVDKIHGIKLTATGNMVSGVPGIKNTAWSADTKSSYLSGNQEVFELPQEFTLNAFMWYTSISTNTYVNAPIVDFGSFNHNTGFGLWLEKEARVAGHLDEGAGYNYGSVVLSPNVWYMVTMTYDGSRMRSYINANLDVDKSYSGAVKQDTLIATFSRGPGGGVTSECWAGKLDEVGLWNYAMTQEEIKKLARAYKMEVSE